MHQILLPVWWWRYIFVTWQISASITIDVIRISFTMIGGSRWCTQVVSRERTSIIICRLFVSRKHLIFHYTFQIMVTAAIVNNSWTIWICLWWIGYRKHFLEIIIFYIVYLVVFLTISEIIMSIIFIFNFNANQYVKYTGATYCY